MKVAIEIISPRERAERTRHLASVAKGNHCVEAEYERVSEGLFGESISMLPCHSLGEARTVLFQMYQAYCDEYKERPTYEGKGGNSFNNVNISVRIYRRNNA